MIKCSNCGTESPDSCQFCDECGTRLALAISSQDAPAYVPPAASEPAARISSPSNVTTVSPNETFAPPAFAANGGSAIVSSGNPQTSASGKMDAVVVIERGVPEGHIFRVVGTDCIIGRWDADNGVFPDIDLDAFDPEAKVSRRHARIRMADGNYTIEDLGSTNGTYLNRGRRLIPGMPQVIRSGDEVIVGKTFLRFKIGEHNA